MTWGYFVNFGRDGGEGIRAIYNHPNCITLDEIDFSGNTYKLKQ